MGLLSRLKKLLGAEPERPELQHHEDPDLAAARQRIRRLDARIEIIEERHRRQQHEGGGQR